MEIEENVLSVEGKVIAIIGATGILGTEYVKHLSSLGAKVIIGDVGLERCIDLSRKISDDGYTSDPIRVDITDESSIVNFFNEINEKHKRVDVLINNSQVKPDGFYNSFENYSKKTLKEVVDGNLIGVTLSCREAIKLFLNQGGGIIINVSSIYGIVAADQRIYKEVENIYFPEEKMSSPVSYAISKAGVVQLTRYLASYYRNKNIRVNCITT